MIYWDHNATAPLRPSALKAMTEALECYHGNPNSSHLYGQESRGLIEEVRLSLARTLKCSPSELIFTSSATESNFLALWSLWLNRKPHQNTILTSPIEHSSVHENILFLKDRFGAQIKFFPLMKDGQTKEGQVDLSAAEEMLNDDTVAFTTLIAAHNETGILQPWKELAALAASKNVPFHSDLVQYLGRLPLELKSQSGLTSATLAFHKMGGPKGVGLLWIRDGVKFDPFIRGGAQEKGRRPGTENIVAISGVGGLLQDLPSLISEFDLSIRPLRDRFESELLANWGQCTIVGKHTARLPNTSYIIFDSLKAESLLAALNLQKICASSGSACSSGLVKPSRALMEMGFSEKQALAAIRFSLGPSSTENELSFVIHQLSQVLKRLAA